MLVFWGLVVDGQTSNLENLTAPVPVALRRSVTVKSSKVGCCALANRRTSWIHVTCRFWRMRPFSFGSTEKKILHPGKTNMTVAKSTIFQ